jgi:NADH-quinone oxidoreductase subunit G
MEIVRGSNRDKSGINGDFLCIKGRYAFDFTAHAERLKQPLIRKDGRLVPTSWEEAFATVAGRFRQIRDEFGGKTIGVIGSTRTTNEENYLLQKIARVVLGTNNIDHHQTADFSAFFRALADKPGSTASMKDVFDAPAILLMGSDPTYQHPLLAWQIRNNVRLHRARLYVINSRAIKLTRQATCFAQVEDGREGWAVAFLRGDDSAREKCSTNPDDHNNLAALREKLSTEKNLLVVCGPGLHGEQIDGLVRTMTSLIPGCKWVCLGDSANSRGASDMGLYPDLLPGYRPVSDGGEFSEKWEAQVPIEPGLNLLQILEASRNGALKALYVVGSNPVARCHVDPFPLHATFLVVQDLFLTETAQLADVVLPATSAYEKSGTFTNTCGDLQTLKKAAEVVGPKSDLEIIARLAQYMGYPIEKLVRRGEGIRADAGQSRGAQSGELDRQAVWMERQDLEPRLSPFDPNAVLDEIQSVVPAYRSHHIDFSGLARLAALKRTAETEEQLITSSKDDLFSSGSLGRYCSAFRSVMERHLLLPHESDSGDRELFAEPREWNDPGSVCPGS